MCTSVSLDDDFINPNHISIEVSAWTPGEPLKGSLYTHLSIYSIFLLVIQVEIFYRMNFRHRYSNGYLHEACTTRAIDDRTELSTEGAFRVDGERISWAKYICTDYDEAMDWSAGYYLLSYNMAPGQTMAEFK